MRRTGQTFTIYTDGGAHPNPGQGGWAAVIINDSTGTSQGLSGNSPYTTNNQMELTAAIAALENLPPNSTVVLRTDSEYLRTGMTKWIPEWRAKSWKRKSGDIQNLELWKRLVDAEAKHDVRWEWLKGHAGNRYNERADHLATTARQSANPHIQRQPTGNTEIFIQVSCERGWGGWAALIRAGDKSNTISGSHAPATANQLDLIAAIAAVDSVPAFANVVIWSGSDYLKNGAQLWLSKWKHDGWKTKSGSPVKNQREWELLSGLLEKRSVEWPDAKGLNITEFVRLAKIARDESRKLQQH